VSVSIWRLCQELLVACQEQIEQCIKTRRIAAAADADVANDDVLPSNDSIKRRALSTVITPTDVRDISLDKQSHSRAQ